MLFTDWGICHCLSEKYKYRKTNNTMLIHIPFDHIKVLDDGNYGCTLKMGKRIYCAVCTPDWDWVKPLHESTFDPYKNYTYIRDKGFLMPSSYYCNKELHRIDLELINLLDLQTEIMLNNVTIDIEDYISDTATSSEEDFVVSLFTTHYLDEDANLAFELTDTLAPYSVMSRAALHYVFDKYRKCDYVLLSAMHKLGISYDSNGPMSEATLELLEMFDRIYKTINGDKFALSKHLVLELATILLSFDFCESKLFEYTRLVYQKYLNPFISERSSL